MILSNLFRALLRQLRRKAGRKHREAARLLEEAERLQQAGDWQQVVRKCECALVLDPDNADAHHRIGIAHAQGERYETAKKYLLKAVTLQPDFAEAYVDIGNVHRLLHDRAAAEASYRSALSIDDRSVLANFNLGQLLKEVGKQHEALHHLRLAHQLDPARGVLLKALVTALLENEQFQEAIAVARQAAKNFPESYEAQLCLGLAYQKSHSATEALKCYDAALSMREDDAELHNNRGIALQELGRLNEAIASYERALELSPDFPLAKFHRALAYLMTGNYLRGWVDYETRLLSVDRPARPLCFPRWDGAPLAGRTLLVYGDQGIGDEIMFASCLPDVMRMDGRVIIECSPKLEKIFARSFPGATVYSWVPGQPAPTVECLREVDLEVPSSSLGLYYRRALSDFPDHKGYLVAAPERVLYWKNRLVGLGPGLKIGVSWKGGTFKTRSPKRSIPLERWLPILRTRGARFISLQYTIDAISELTAFHEQYGAAITHWPEAIEDYDETAALVMALDMVISVCTAVIHLGGALGKPVWVMAPYSPEWRYGYAGERMPWYPSVRIFRQEEIGAWDSVIETVAGCLHDFERQRDK